MKTEQSESLIRELQMTQQQISRLLASVAHDQDWQPAPDQWSFRYLAGHLATCESECVQERMRLIAAGDNPHFELYRDTGRDFSHLELMRSLQAWAATRQAIFDFVRALPKDQWALTGTHKAYGSITILDYLQLDLEHDQGHIRDLEVMLAAHRQAKTDTGDSPPAA